MFAAVLQAGSHRIVRAHDLLGLGRLRARWRVGVKALALVFWPLGRWRWRWRFMALGRRWVGVEAGPLTTHVAKAGRKVSARSRWLTTALTRNTPGSGSALGLAHTKEMINLSNLPTWHLFGCADERTRESEEQTMRAKQAQLHATCVEIVYMSCTFKRPVMFHKMNFKNGSKDLKTYPQISRRVRDTLARLL